MLSGVKLTNAHTVHGRPTLKFPSGLVCKLKEKLRKLSRLSKTMDLIDTMTNRNIRSVVSGLRVARFV